MEGGDMEYPAIDLMTIPDPSPSPFGFLNVNNDVGGASYGMGTF